MKSRYEIRSGAVVSIIIDKQSRGKENVVIRTSSPATLVAKTVLMLVESVDRLTEAVEGISSYLRREEG